jgi:type I restriction-modification system DNA methylase subunit
MDLLEAVIGLGPNLFYGTGLAACILVFRQKKSKDRKNKVLIVDASKEFKTGRAQNELLPEHVERIHGWVSRLPGRGRHRPRRHPRRDRRQRPQSQHPRYVEPKVDQ